ncbi:MAG: hypothetical protein K0R50_503 [Eubacterium sp.]|jgi:CubicO group peptidase (beta-lactamase class C family)|nr:hypothetical protein [Eubacterium sp.]
MRKIVIILLITCLAVVQTSCSSSRDTSDKSANSTEIAANGQVYQWPTEEWSTSTPEKQAIASEQLDKADKRIDENYPNIYSLLVVRNGCLVYEKYYNGASEDTYNPVYSVTKSVLSALTGIAVHEKVLSSTDQKVSDIIPDYFASLDNNKKKDITLKNVLTMTGGLETIDTNYPGFFSSPDWLEYALEKPLTNEPGSKFVYNTGLTHILSGIITAKTGMNTKEYADKYLFGPLNIKVKRWDRDSAGTYGGGTGLYLTPRDMAKFGYLYLNKGKWEDKQLIPQEWVEESTKKQIQASEEVGYGYLFWVQTMTDKTRNKLYETYRADGAGGQKIIVIPEINTIAVVTANLNSSSRDKADTQNLVEDYVLPAIK